MEPNLQPLLHDLVTTACAPTCALSGRDGQIRATGVHGVFRADLRVLASALVAVDGREPDPIGYAPEGPGSARFVGLARNLGDPGPDPTVRLDRLRRMRPDGMLEEIRIRSTAEASVAFTLTIDIACDLAPIEAVKSGGTAAPRQPQPVPDGLRWSWVDGSVTVTGDAASVEVAAARLAWAVRLAPGESATLRWRVRVADRSAMVAAPTGPVEWARPAVTADDRRLVRLLGQALDDLETLRLVPAEAASTVESGRDTFLGAGVPWFLTLFGRDSIWAARMMLPLGTELAAGTLRLLAARQGRAVDRNTGEAPGKIMHELRRHRLVLSGQNIALPATYFGTVDATPLWISLLHDAWRWGMPAEQVASL
ncbi:MAG: amylo-alpha-1,6-glucosidase, partial [Micromonosporaceae bacterium]|nr:amylo-alpha-1,6-glucosidase [Micromonosporaceae bacterium]